MQFNDHLPTAEQDLIDAFASFRSQNVADLVLDLRYNGGGSLAIASEVAYMIAGNVPTAGQPFERLVFNDKHTAINPVTGGALTPVPFYQHVEHESTAADAESVTRLRADGLDDVLGQRIDHQRTARRERASHPDRLDDLRQTYGFYPEDNCGTTYFTIQMKGVNAAGFGDYGDGFSPNNTAGRRRRAPARGAPCATTSARPLGNPAEERFAAALQYRHRDKRAPRRPGSKPSFTKPMNGAPSDEARRQRAQVAVADEPLAGPAVSTLRRLLAAAALLAPAACGTLSAQEQPAVIAAPTRKAVQSSSAWCRPR